MDQVEKVKLETKKRQQHRKVRVLCLLDTDLEGILFIIYYSFMPIG